PSLWFAVLGPSAAAIFSALIESVPVRLDDNISIPATAAAVLWFASLVTPGAVAVSTPAVVAALPWALGIHAVFAVLGYRAGTVSAAGAIVGALIGITIYVGGGPGAWLLLFATFAVATVVSRLGLERKAVLGIAEEHQGRRGPGNALGNCGVATLAAVA